VTVVAGSTFAENDFVKVTGTGEIMEITAVNSNALTVTRGFAGTTAAEIPAAATALTKQKLTAADAAAVTTSTNAATFAIGALKINVVDGSVFLVNDFVKVGAEVMKITAISVAATTTTTATYLVDADTINVVDGSAFAQNDFVRVGDEVMKITSDTTSNALTVTRAAAGSTAAAKTGDTLVAMTKQTVSYVATSTATTTNADGYANSASVVAITVALGSTFAVNDFVKVGNEVMKITEIVGNILTVTRAAAGTTLGTITGATAMVKQTVSYATADADALTVTRGVVGTTAATITGTTLMTKHGTTITAKGASTGYTTTTTATYLVDATTINVVDGSVFAANDFVKVVSEVMKITSISGNALTVTRAAAGSTAAAKTGDTLVAMTKQTVAFAPPPSPAAATTKLKAGTYAASVTTLVVVAGTDFSNGDFIKIGDEVMKLVTKSTHSFVVERGAAGTAVTASIVAASDTDTAVTKQTVTYVDSVSAFATNTVGPYTIATTATAINVVDSSIFLVNDVVKVSNEAMVITAIVGNTLTVTRGAAGTTAAAITAEAAMTRQSVTFAPPPSPAAAATTLTAGTYAGGITTLVVVDGTAFANGDLFKVGSGTEIMKLVTKSTHSFVVERGAAGTTVTASITATGTDTAVVKVTPTVAARTDGRTAGAPATTALLRTTRFGSATQLAAGTYASTDLTLLVTSGAAFSNGDFIKIGSEIMKLVTKTGNSFVVERGVAGTAVTASIVASGSDTAVTTQKITVADPAGSSAAATKLKAGTYAASVTTLVVVAGTDFANGDFIKIGSEIMKLVTKTGNSFVVERGVAGTAVTASIVAASDSDTAVTKQTLTLAAANLIPLSGFVVGGTGATATFNPAVLDTTCADATVSPTASPTMAPTVAPTTGPTRYPTLATGTAPTDAPTPAPTPVPTAAPSKAPTSKPTLWPTDYPTNLPTPIPSDTPTAIPSAAPTAVGATLSPTTSPTAAPTLTPTTPNPTNAPTNTPTIAPTITPAPTAVGVTTSPTTSPTMAPTTAPTEECNGDGHMVVTYTVAVTATQKPGVDTFHSGTLDLTDATKLGLFQSGLRNAFAEVQCFYATEYPTTMPSALPTTMPTFAPNTKFPTPAPSSVPPSLAPTATPTVSPTNTPTATPTVSPTNMPTMTPTDSPTATPTATPTKFPTKKPTVAATGVTNLPTATPTATPTSFPTSYPSVASHTASPTHMPTKIPTAQYSGSPLLFPGCDAKIKFSAFDCGSGACSYTGVAAVGATPAPTPQTFQVVGSMVLSAFTKVSFSADHQSAFKTTLKSTVKMVTLSDDSIILSITEVPSTRRLTSRRLAGGISVSYTITGVSASAADSAIATLSDPNAGISFTATLKTELQAKGVAAPDGGWDAVTATPGAVTKEDTNDAVATATPAPTTVPQTVPPTAATTVALSRACSLRANTIAILSTVLLAIWATSVGTEHC
jgi:hypothetical protein